MHSAQRDGIATRTGHLRPEDALDEIVRFFEARVSALRRSGVAADRLILDPGMGFFLSPAPETSLHVLSNLQKLKSALGLPLLVSVSRKSFLGATVGLPVKDLGPASLAAELHAIGNGADYVRTHAHWRSAKRNHLLGNPREISQSRRQRPRVRSCLAFTFRPPASGPLVRFREGGRRHAGLVRIKLHYEAAVHTAPGANGQRGASERSGRLLG